MLSHKNILNGLSRAVYGGKPHDVPKALQSVNMKNTSERRRKDGGREEGGRGRQPVGVCIHGNADMWPDESHFAISVREMTACTNVVRWWFFIPGVVRDGAAAALRINYY